MDRNLHDNARPTAHRDAVRSDRDDGERTEAVAFAHDAIIHNRETALPPRQDRLQRRERCGLRTAR